MQYFTGTDTDGNQYVGVIIIHNGRYFILSDNENSQSNHLPQDVKLGFAYAEEVTSAKTDKEYTASEFGDETNSVYDMCFVNKIEGLRAIIHYRKNHIEVADYQASFDGRDFTFGCGAVTASPEQVKLVLKMLKTFDDKEMAELSEVIEAIFENDISTFGNLKGEEADIKKLLQMPTYLATLKRKQNGK